MHLISLFNLLIFVCNYLMFIYILCISTFYVSILFSALTRMFPKPTFAP